MWPYSKDDWFKLPIKLRERWWEETDYNRNLPSAELATLIDEEFKKLGIIPDARPDRTEPISYH